MTHPDGGTSEKGGSVEARVARLEALLHERGVGGQLEIDEERNATSRGLSHVVETGREVSERDREQAEQGRAIEERRRVGREAQREQGEQDRVLSEELRAIAEETRRMAEEAREIAEAAREKTEALRLQIVRQDELIGDLRVAMSLLQARDRINN